MVEICQRLFVGAAADFEESVIGQAGWWTVHACKEPYHRELLGYRGRGAPNDHPEYLWARRDKRLFLNLVDVEEPAYIAKEIVDEALAFTKEAIASGDRALIHCNQGESRAPSLGLLYLVSQTNVLPKTSLGIAEDEFRKVYPAYAPKGGMRGFIESHWAEYAK
ncbi:MAG: phosphatase [Candidatus Coatesbacteria bacterium]